MLRAAVKDKVLERQIDGGGDETRTEDQTANLQFEARLAPWIVVHDDATGVSSGFEKRPNAQSKGVSPCLAHDTDNQASEEADAENSAEEGVDP